MPIQCYPTHIATNIKYKIKIYKETVNEISCYSITA